MTTSLLPSIRAELGERFILNFRMAPDALRKYLPVAWLEPQLINGFAVASYCLLDLRHITVAPLAPKVGLHSLSCAPRYAVLDMSGEQSKPAVFVTERQTNSAFGAWFTTLGFSAPHPHVEAAIRQENGVWDINVQQPAGEPIFAARVRRTDAADSSLFSTTSAFADFIAQSVSSYGLSRHDARLTKIDLRKQDRTYEPLEVLALSGPAAEAWQADGAVLDSAFRTAGGCYEWTYLGLTDE